MIMDGSPIGEKSLMDRLETLPRALLERGQSLFSGSTPPPGQTDHLCRESGGMVGLKAGQTSQRDPESLIVIAGRQLQHDRVATGLRHDPGVPYPLIRER